MKPSKAQRRNIYLEAAECFDSDIIIFVCIVIAYESDLLLSEVTYDLFPEIFLFKERDSSAWLSKQIADDGISIYSDGRKANEIKQTCLIFSAEMTLTENL